MIIIGNRYHLFSTEKDTLNTKGIVFEIIKEPLIEKIKEIIDSKDGNINTIVLNLNYENINDELSDFLDILGEKYKLIKFQEFISEQFNRCELDYHELVIDKESISARKTYNSYVKPAIDFILGLFLLILLSPVYIIIAILIKYEDNGSAMYVQKRVGKNGKLFNFLKFRTMYMDSEERLEKLLKSDAEINVEWHKNYKLQNDPRITKIGKFLRKSSLDELPQIINVLKFELSLVGPRALPEYHLNQFPYEFIQMRNIITPGITGEWQTSGRSEASGLEDFIKKDLKYIKKLSFIYDIILLFRTVLVVALGKGAV